MSGMPRPERDKDQGQKATRERADVQKQAAQDAQEPCD